jgi:hypothetical protein
VKTNTLIKSPNSIWDPWTKGMLAKEGAYGKVCKLTSEPDRWGDVSTVFETGATKDVKTDALVRASNSSWDPWTKDMLGKAGAYGKVCKLTSDPDRWGDVTVVFETGVVKEVKVSALTRCPGSGAALMPTAAGGSGVAKQPAAKPVLLPIARLPITAPAYWTDPAQRSCASVRCSVYARPDCHARGGRLRMLT